MELDSVTWRGNRVVVEVMEPEEKIGSIFLPANFNKPNGNDDKPWRGKVVAFGDKVSKDWIKAEEVKVGDVFYIRPISYHCPTFKGADKKTYISVIPDEDLLGKELPEAPKYILPDLKDSPGGMFVDPNTKTMWLGINLKVVEYNEGSAILDDAKLKLFNAMKQLKASKLVQVANAAQEMKKFVWGKFGR